MAIDHEGLTSQLAAGDLTMPWWSSAGLTSPLVDRILWTTKDYSTIKTDRVCRAVGKKSVF
jgi:hypothetical protein